MNSAKYLLKVFDLKRIEIFKLKNINMARIYIVGLLQKSRLNRNVSHSISFIYGDKILSAQELQNIINEIKNSKLD